MYHKYIFDYIMMLRDFQFLGNASHVWDEGIGILTLAYDGACVLYSTRLDAAAASLTAG